jgi:8-oxo-dGTP diphosphatase
MAEQMVVVAALVRDGSGRVFVSRRKPESFQGGRWEFPGGAVELMEKPEDALKRELKEELGVKAEVGRIFSVDSHTYTLNDGNLRHIILLTYETKIKSGEPKAIGCSEFKWADAKELESLDFVDADKKILRKIT